MNDRQSPIANRQSSQDDFRYATCDLPALPRWLWAYDMALALAGALWLPYYLAVRRPGYPGLRQRFGSYPESVHEALCRRRRPVWLHAVSVGEVLVALSFLAALSARRRGGPEHRWVLSTVTPTGQRLAKERAPSQTTVLYAPWDLSSSVRRALEVICPRLFVGFETELWPNLLLRLEAAGVPAVIVNGRISERSFRRYRIVRRWLAPALAPIRLWAMQTPADAERVTALGVPASRVHVTGNLKADVPPPALDVARLEALRQRLGTNGQTTLWIAGSTHPGEEAMVVSAFRQVHVDQPRLRLLVAPRHPERVPEVERLVQGAGLTPQRWSQMAGHPWHDTQTVVIVDTLGELAQLYAVADVVFIGGSLVPHGGHNLMEPAQFAKPVVTGPYTQNFQSVVELLQAAEGVRVVSTVEELAAQLRQWLAHPDRRREVGERAKAAVAAQAGATAKTIELLFQELGDVLRSEA